MPRFCERCGASLSASANFCPNCGFALTASAFQTPARGAASGPASSPASGPASGPASSVVRALPWIIPSAAVVAVIAFAIASGRPDPQAGPMAGGFSGAASDISQLSGDERVDRLFNRVMAAASEGKMDTVAFFAPMAVMSFQALAPLTPHRRYDLGLIYLVSGEPALARAEADTILAGAPRHLLGLALAMRSARAAGDDAARQRFAARFLQALPSERTRDVPEYVDHETDIIEATAEAEGRSTGTKAWSGAREG
ncbi:MAG: zinc ribbon domain-containing protein [Gemmatimonadaceae bacterium]